jgi:hypothetical protein
MRHTGGGRHGVRLRAMSSCSGAPGCATGNIARRHACFRLHASVSDATDEALATDDEEERRGSCFLAREQS